MGLWGDIEHGFSATMNGVEYAAKDVVGLVDQAVSELASLGIGAFGGIEELIKFFLEMGEDPITTINQLRNRIESMGGGIATTLEELTSGIMAYGLMPFAQQKVLQSLTPMQAPFQKSTNQGQAVADLHQITIKTMQVKLDALTTGATTSGQTWQGPGMEAMNASFLSLSGNLTSLSQPLESGNAQARLNQICAAALEAIVVVGGIVLVCELVVTCIVAIPGLLTGPGDLVVLGAGAGLMAETLEALFMLVAADLMAWLVGSIAIYIINHPITFGSSHTITTNNGTGGVNIVQASASNLPLNPGQIVSGGRIYIPPKSGHGKPVRDPQGKGFIDAKGNVWEWAPGGAQHGGPHWDVQHPDGSHTNVAPNGKVIGKDNFPNNDSLNP